MPSCDRSERWLGANRYESLEASQLLPFGFFSTDHNLKIQQPLAQYFASRMINLEWMQFGDGKHQMYTASGDVDDGAGHSLVTAYPVLRPDGNWALLVVNKDQENEHTVGISFEDSVHHRSGRFDGAVAATVFGKAEYQWHPEVDGGRANPDGPPSSSRIDAGPDTRFRLPAASITVLRGKMAMSAN